MKHRLIKGIILSFFIIALYTNCTPQDASGFTPDAVHVVDTADFNYLKNKYPLDSVRLSALHDQIDNFKSFDQNHPPRKGAIVFVGSSSMMHWNYRIEADMEPLPVLDRGFGGSVLLENIFYYPRIVKTYNPRIVVLYCENDILGNPVNVIYEKVRYFENLLHSDFPNCILYIISFKPSPARRMYIPAMEELNADLQEYALARPNTEFIDVFHPMMPDGKINESIFTADNLHMNDAGYDLWTGIIKPQLLKAYFGSTALTLVGPEGIKTPVTVKNKMLTLHKEMSKIKIYDLYGKLRATINTSGTKNVNVEFLTSGIYILEATSTSSEEPVREKIIIN